MNWTEERLDKLAREWNAGKTATEIASILGIGRGAVIGKVTRMGLLGDERIKRRTASFVNWTDKMMLDLLSLIEHHKMTFDEAAHQLGVVSMACEHKYREIIRDLKKSDLV